MSRRHKRRESVQTLRSVRSIRELGQPVGDQDYEINDGEEFQARDGSNVKTMAEAEAEERRERRDRPDLRLADRPRARTEKAPAPSIPRLVWRLVTTPWHLAVAVLRVAIPKGQNP